MFRKSIFALIAGICLTACQTTSSPQEPPQADAPLYGPWVLSVDGESAVFRWEALPTDAPSSAVLWEMPDGTEQTIEVTSYIRVGVQSLLETATLMPDSGPYRLYEAAVPLAGAGTYRWRTDTSPAVEGEFIIPAADGTAKVLLIGDSNNTSPHAGADAVSDTVTGHLLLRGSDAFRPHALVHAGDIVYNASVPVDSYLKFWSNYTPVLRHMLFLPSIGNHEYENEIYEPPGEWVTYGAPFAAIDPESLF